MKILICTVLLLFLSLSYSKDIKVALVMSGEYNDLGYNYMLNFGRIRMEQALNISSTTLVSNIATEEDAIAEFEKLALEGYNYIISGSFEHGKAIEKIADSYPDVYWTDKGRKKPTQPNINRVFFNGLDTKYIMGLYAGLMTTSGKVGIVVPGPPVDPSYSTNTFFLGAKHANPNCTVYVIKTGTYLDPDLASGATKKLMELGADVIGQIQDDTTVTETTMEAGLLGIGNTGFPLSDIFGEKLGIGFVQDWSPFFTTIAKSILDDAWVPSRHMQGGFNNGQQSLDKMSYRVPDPVRSRIMSEIQQSIDEPFFYLCGPLVAEIPHANASSDCITQSEMFSSEQLSGISDLGNYTIPLTEFTLSESTKLGFTSVVSIVLILTGLVMIGLAICRNATIIMSSSPLFTEIMCAGAVFIFASCLLWIQVPTDTTCEARVWLASLGYDLLIGSLMIKNIRIWRIFDNPEYKKRKYPDWKLLAWLLVKVIIDVILLAVWNSVAIPKAFDYLDLDQIGKYNYMTICTTEPNGDYVLYSILIVHMIWLLFGCFLSYKLKSKVTMKQFDEGEQIAMILYSIAICISVVIPFLVAPQTTESRIIIINTAMVFTATGSLIILFSPKIIYISKNGMQFKTRSGSNSGRTSSQVKSKSTSNADLESASGVELQHTQKTTTEDSIETS